MFTNIISCMSSRFDFLWSKTRSTSNLTDLRDFLFLIRLSRNFSRVFTNIISCTSLRFGLLRLKTRSESNLTDFLASPLYRLYFLSNCQETSHTCSQTSSLVRVRVLTCGQIRIWQIFCTTLQTLFLIRLSRNFTQVFTNIISWRSSHFNLLRSKTRSTLNLTDFYFLSDRHETSHMCPQTSSLLRVRV